MRFHISIYFCGRRRFLSFLSPERVKTTITITMSSSFTSLHITALDAIVNVNSLFHPRRLHRPNLEPQRPFQQPQLRSGVCPHRRHRREPHRLPRLLFQLLPLLQPRRPRPQAGHPPLPHHLLPLPRRRRPPRRGRQPHRPPPRHARLRRRIRRRLRLPHARARQRGADQARNPRLRKLTHLRRRRSASHLRPPRAPHLRLPRSLRLHTLAR